MIPTLKDIGISHFQSYQWYKIKTQVPSQPPKQKNTMKYSAN